MQSRTPILSVVLLLAVLSGAIQSRVLAQSLNTGDGKGDALWEYSLDLVSWFPAVEVSSALNETESTFSWAGDSYSPFSRWISVSTGLAEQAALIGQTYWFRASFTAVEALPIKGRLLVDEGFSEFLLNGENQGLGGGGNWAGPWLDFETASSAVVGPNVVRLAVDNIGGYWTGIRVEATVPEPSTYALLAMSGVGALWWARRKRWFGGSSLFRP